MDELTRPDSALAGEPPRTERIGRAAMTITAWNLVSRATGFVRVVATGAALGILSLGDTYQSANFVSNILFELLAGGLLFSVLVPTFVAMLDSGRRADATALAAALLGRALAVLAVIAALGALAGPWVMRALTAGGDDPAIRAEQVRVGSFLLWFFMPQLLLYASGAVASALLQADRRFTAAAVAPVFNNVVVTATMVAFALVHEPAGDLSLTLGEKVLLGGGTLAGTVALVAAPFVAAGRAGLGFTPRWSAEVGPEVGALARKGLWGAGHVGLNQALVAATIIFAGRVQGGVIAYQIAFTFFLLPHAVLAHPIFTALFPRLAAHAGAKAMGEFADDVGFGVRAMALLLAPAAALLAVVALPALSVVRVGALDAEGARLVASVLAAYSLGLLGYSAFFLLTRACYALGDVRTPTIVNLWVTVGAVAGMAVASSLVDGDRQVVVLGLVHGVAVSAGSMALFVRVRRAAGRPVPVIDAFLRAGAGAALAATGAAVVVHALGTVTRSRAAAGLVLGGVVGVALYGMALWLLRTPELRRFLADPLRRRPDQAVLGS